jgi:hypothetical protein
MYATRGYISNLWKQPREFIEVEQKDSEQIELKSGVFEDIVGTKYTEHKDDVGPTRREMAFAVDL